MKRILGLFLAALMMLGCLGPNMTVEASSSVRTSSLEKGMLLVPGTWIEFDGNIEDIVAVTFPKEYERYYASDIETAMQEVPGNVVGADSWSSNDGDFQLPEVVSAGYNCWKVWGIFGDLDGNNYTYYLCPGKTSAGSEISQFLQVNELEAGMLLEPGQKIRADECLGASIELIILLEEFADLYNMDYWDALMQIWDDGNVNEIADAIYWYLYNKNDPPGDAGSDYVETFTVPTVNVPGYNCWKVWRIEEISPNSLRSSNNSWYLCLVPAKKPVSASSESDFSASDSSLYAYSACDHEIKHIITQEPTEVFDGIVSVKCTKCDYTKYTYKISGYGKFLSSTADKIKNAAPDATVRVMTNRWCSFDKEVLQAIEGRPDVTIVIDYWYTDGVKGEMRSITIPAGFKVLQFANEEGFCGFEYLAYQLAVAALASVQ